ncbi:MAG: monovalent cation:proton antiporter-2 (CPA2) family protein, partial [Usitatibacter sp.]
MREALIFLAAAVICVPVAARLKLGSVLGYLIAGAAIGPWGLNFVDDVDKTQNLAELGVVLMLFVIGLELDPRRLLAMRKEVFGGGTLQLAACGAVLGLMLLALGLPWQAALVAGLARALSSTAIAIQTMNERNELKTPTGHSVFGILLFQDIAAIPLIALVPILGRVEKRGDDPLWLKLTLAAAAIAGVVVIGRYLTRPVLRVIAKIRIRELFTAFALLLVIGIAQLVSLAGLSMALGAFLAGVLLADSEFRHELEADVEPFKGLLMGLFFMAVGMSANLSLFAAQPFAVLSVAAGLMLLKAALMYATARLLGSGNEDAQRIAVWIAAGGEFAFVLFTAAQSEGILEDSTAQFFILAVTVSMLLSPLTFVAHERLLTRWQERRKPP